MNGRIRSIGLMLIVLFSLLVANLTYIQVIRADSLNHNAANARRIRAREYAMTRGPIISADGKTVAQSIPASGELKHQRQYPLPGLMANVVGIKSPLLGATLTESAYNAQLQGEEPLTVSSWVDQLSGVRNGNTVVLSLDTKVQQVAADSLGDQIGAVAAINPKTGFVYALYSSPTYDPNPLVSNNFKDAQAASTAVNADPAKPNLPRAYREVYPPGSTFKIVTAAAALEAGIATPQTTFAPTTEIPLPGTNQTLSNDQGERCGGTLVESFAESCNTVFAELGRQLGPQRLGAMASQFGYNQDVQFPLRAVKSTFPAPSAFANDTAGLMKSAIGQQDVRSTALQDALLSAVVANGGLMMRPQVVTEVRDPSGTTVQTFAPQQWQRAIQPGTAGSLTQMMLECVRSGTGTKAQIPGVQVAGKTGTAQTGNPVPDAWFTAFAPADNPTVAVAVVVQRGGYGGRAALPIAKAVIETVLGKGGG